MLKLIGFIIFVGFFIQTSSAQYEVLDVRKAKTYAGKKIKRGTFLEKSDSIVILENGEITLDVESAMHMRLAAGMYHVGSESARHNEWYSVHLALTKELKKKGMIMCKFRYKTLSVPGSDRHYEVDRIELDQKGLVRFNSDTAALTISWVNPNHKYKGSYHLIIRDFYNNGFIDIIKTDKDTLTFYPGKYGHKHMYYNIIADDCRASLRYKIEVNTPNAQINSATTFINIKN